MPEQRYDIAIIGAGIVGLATAMEMLTRFPSLRLVVLQVIVSIGAIVLGATLFVGAIEIIQALIQAFDLKGGLSAARRFCDRTRIFLLAASLGGVESLIVLPIYTSHYRMSTVELAAAGVGPGTVRMSVGLEDPGALIADPNPAFS